MEKRAIIIAGILIVALIICMRPCFAGSSAELKTIRIGYQPSVDHAAMMIAAEKGWWEEDLRPFGIEKVEFRRFPSGPPEMHAMLAGDLDVAYVGVAPPVVAICEGLDAKIVAGVQIQGSAIVVRPELAGEYREKGALALKGKRIATFPPGSIQHTILSKWLSEHGIDLEKDVDYKPMGPSDAVTAIGAGVVDAVFLPTPSPAILETEGTGVVVERSGNIWPNHACCCLVASGRMMREHPELLKQIIKTHIKATEYAIAHPEEAAEVYSKWEKADLSVIEYCLNTTDMRWIHDPHVQIESTLEQSRIVYELNRERYEAMGIKEPLGREDLFDTSFYDEVIAAPAPTPTPTPTPTPMPSPTPSPPGFEAAFAIISLLVVYLTLRR